MKIIFNAWDLKYQEIMENVQDRQSFTKYHYEETGEYLGFHAMLNNPLFVLIQYTGLRDKNNIKIFEADILKVTKLNRHGKWYVVLAGGGFYCFKKGQGGCVDIFSLDVMDGDNLEIIGNIYQNKELIKE